jgi:branched-chain amino acid transport system substrate-binding protein
VSRSLPPIAQAPAPPPAVVPAPRAPDLAPPEGPPRNRVGLLLPLSGGNRQLGEQLLNAAQLALFDLGDNALELLPRDTRGTPAGAAEATRTALGQGARAFAGPLTLAETNAAAPPARSGRAPVLALTNDAAQAGNGVYVMGVTIGEQTDRIAAAAITAGARRFGLIGPDGEVGRRLANALRAQLAAAGLPPPLVQLYAPLGDPATSAKDLATQAGPEGLDAIVLAAFGEKARLAAQTLNENLPKRTRLLGLTVWANDSALLRDPQMAGAWFANADPTARAEFESRYQAAYGEKPPRVAGVAYDAAALALRTARTGASVPPVGEALMGADGPIVVTPQGLAKRGLAIFELQADGEPKLIEAAPVPGAAGV